jgi:hypothetical protein
MKITVDVLYERDACDDGMIEFEYVFPGGLDPADVDRWGQTILIGALGKWWGWAVGQGLIPAWSMAGADLACAQLAGLFRDSLSHGYNEARFWERRGRVYASMSALRWAVSLTARAVWCALVGHMWEEEGHADVENGEESLCCTRCGYPRSLAGGSGRGLLRSPETGTGTRLNTRADEARRTERPALLPQGV